MDLERLTLDERCRLLGGATTWRTHGIERLGIPPVTMSDGPNGVRGEPVGASFVESVAVPVGIALGSTWDPELVGAIGDLLGREARRKAVHVLLGPTVNLHRTPIGGRVFESFSEDPELTARLAVAYVRGVQAHGVAVAVKHFVANDTEVERMWVDVRLAESTLRELYLRPFEAVVREAGAWGIMAAYNRVDGEFCAHNGRLLREILRDEWGFDGFVVSDWIGAHDTVAAAEGGLTVAMPGPITVFGEQLSDAVRKGEVDPAVVDARVAELQRLLARTHAASRPSGVTPQAVDDPDERALCRRAAIASLVLVVNRDGTLPLAAGERVAVIGPNAARTRIMGGGSSSLDPLPYPPILDALVDRLGAAVVAHAPGSSIDVLAPRIGGPALRAPDGQPGLLLVEFRDGSDPDVEPVAYDVVRTSRFMSFGNTPEGIGDREFWVTLVGDVVPEHDGPHVFGAIVAGKGRVTVGDAVVLDDPDRRLPRGEWMFGWGSEEQTAVVDCRAGEPLRVQAISSGIQGFTGLTLGARLLDPPPLLDEAVAVAASCDVAVVVVGTNDEWETEGTDRTTIALPGDQDELVRRVAAVAPRTVVVVNAGSPVAMPWVDEVDAVLVASFAGEETGPAVAAVLVGDADPGGRLPISYPRRLEDCPAWPHYRPVAGTQTYGEGRFMGYRGHDASGVEPLWPFGHGLSYGTSRWEGARLSTSGVAAEAEGSVTVAVDVTATGERPATEVVQVYATHPCPEMPPKALVAFARTVVPPGTTTTVSVDVPVASLRRWDDVGGHWTIDPGDREILVAASAGDIRARLPLRVVDRK